jgi:hypothetical protein
MHGMNNVKAIKDEFWGRDKRDLGTYTGYWKEDLIRRSKMEIFNADL